MAFTITKTVRPNAMWQEMYLQVAKDQRVIIAAEGLWSPEMRPATIVWCGPDGIQGRITGEDYLVPGANLAALCGDVQGELAKRPQIEGAAELYLSPATRRVFDNAWKEEAAVKQLKASARPSAGHKKRSPKIFPLKDQSFITTSYFSSPRSSSQEQPDYNPAGLLCNARNLTTLFSFKILNCS